MDFIVKGMSCASCQAHVEKAVSSIDGVSSCTVSLLTNSMKVEGNVSSNVIIEAVSKAGYSAYVQGSKEEIKVDDSKNLKMKLMVSILLLFLLMYISMGHTMFHLPVPSFMNNVLILAILQMLLTICIMILNQKFFINGIKGILNHSMNMDTLVSLGSFSSFIYSLYLVFKMCTLDTMDAMSILHGLYFESASMILVLISVGKLLEERSKGKTTDAIQSLMNLKPKTAIKKINNEEVIVDIDQIQIHPTVEQSTAELISESVRGSGAILLDSKGERFTNEMLTRDVVSANINALEEGYSYVFFDNNLRTHKKAIDKYVNKGVVTQAATLDEMAVTLGMDADTLKENIAQYNAVVRGETVMHEVHSGGRHITAFFMSVRGKLSL